MAGRRKKPPQLHVLQGTYRADRHDPAPVGEDVPLEPPPAPAYLRRRRRARALWDEHAAGLAALGVLERLDAWQLGVWCCLVAEFERSPAKMPASRIAQMRALGTTLGLDQASRARLRAEAQAGAPKPSDPLDEFFQ